MTNKISCPNCGPCEDTDCPCSKCVGVMRKRSKVAARKSRKTNRNIKSYKFSED